MSLIALIGLLFDGAQVLVENSKSILLLSVQITGIGVLAFWGISGGRAKGEWHHAGVASLSLGLCGFVLLSYAIVALSRIWHAALPILSSGLFVLSFLGCAAGFLVYIKKKASSAELATLSSRLRSLD
jgi:hypothetical protein